MLNYIYHIIVARIIMFFIPQVDVALKIIVYYTGTILISTLICFIENQKIRKRLY